MRVWISVLCSPVWRLTWGGNARRAVRFRSRSASGYPRKMAEHSPPTGGSTPPRPDRPALIALANRPGWSSRMMMLPGDSMSRCAVPQALPAAWADESLPAVALGIFVIPGISCLTAKNGPKRLSEKDRYPSLSIPLQKGRHEGIQIQDGPIGFPILNKPSSPFPRPEEEKGFSGSLLRANATKAVPFCVPLASLN